MAILRTENLQVYFSRHGRVIKAVDGVDLFLEKGKIISLAGESGCGKTTLAKAILGFNKPKEGKIYFEDTDITLKGNEKLIRKNIRIVFQNPYLSFDPRYTIFGTLYEALRVFVKMTKKKAKHHIIKALTEVELDEKSLDRYPHQLSGGQLQRVSLARALINKPALVILDEPTSSLDMVSASRIIALLEKLQKEYSTTFFFISHNLKLIKKIADYCFIMLNGKIVESGPKGVLYNDPKHPYTKLLLKAVDFKLTDEK